MPQKSRPVEYRYLDCIQQGSINVRLRKNYVCMETNIFLTKMFKCSCRKREQLCLMAACLNKKKYKYAENLNIVHVRNLRLVSSYKT